MRRIDTLLHDAIGLDVQSIGRAAVDKAVAGRIAANHLPDMAAYFALLDQSPSERQALVEAVVVPETWFFRDPEAFTALTLLAARRRLESRTTGGEMRILSLPCSTGEEPYSLAMALLDAGWTPGSFRIDAVDISRPALELARRAVYGPNSFRGAGTFNPGWRERHFTALAANRWQLSQRVCDQVELRHGNLFEPVWAPGNRKYDFVFCRNVLIYFDPARQDQAAHLLTGLLAEGGALFVGPSETAVMLRHGLRSLGIPLAFAFSRAETRSTQGANVANVANVSTVAATTTLPGTAAPDRGARSAGGVSADAPPSTRAADRRLRIVPPGPDAPSHEGAAASRTSEPTPLERARRLADQGRLDEAARLCENLIASGKPDAATFYLLALIRDATGDTTRARVLFRKTLYLDPDNDAAMAHLAALLELEGDSAGAARLRQRAVRTTSRFNEIRTGTNDVTGTTGTAGKPGRQGDR